jgi:tetratricopeptide (TPR) repeat protein
MSNRSAAEVLATELRRLYEAAHRPTYGALISRARKQQPPVRLNSKTLSDWFSGKSVPRDARAVSFLIGHLEALAEQHGDYQRRGEKWWQDQRQRAWDQKHANHGGRPHIESSAPRSSRPVPVGPSHDARTPFHSGRLDDHRGAPPDRIADGLAVPRQLPAPAGLAGRKNELARIRSVLFGSRPTHSGPWTVPSVVGIDGIPGVGKSALALAAAHACAEVYPDGQLYVDLQGASPGIDPLSPGEVLGRFLRALDVPPDRISPDTSEAAALFRSVTATKRILVVLDNARDLTQVRPLIPAGPACATVITSRTSMTPLAAAIADMILIHLDPLDRVASVELLRRHLDERIDHEPVAAEELASLCGHLPLALRVVGARLSIRTGQSLSFEATRLRTARRRLDELGVGDLDVRSSLALSLENLLEGSEDSRAAVALFGLLGVLPTAQITPLAASALLDTDEPTAQRLLDLLVDHCLLTPLIGGHQLHDLLRELARQHAELHPNDTAAALHRVVDRYISVMCADPAIYRPFPSVSSDPVASRPPAQPTDPAVPPTDAAEWLTHHLPSLGALIAHLASRPTTVRRAYELLWPIGVRLLAHHPADYTRLCRVILAGSGKADKSAAATIVPPLLLNIVNAQVATGRLTQANQDLDEAKRCLPTIKDDRFKARALTCEALVRSAEDNLPAALECALEAAALSSRLGLAAPLATSLAVAGRALLRQGRNSEALVALKHSAAIEAQLGVARKIAKSSGLYQLTLAHLRTGRPDLAKQVADEAIEIAQAPIDHASLADRLALRSDIWLALHRPADATTDAETAISIARRLAAQGSLEPLLHALQTYSVVLWRARDPQAHSVLAEIDAVAANLQAMAAQDDRLATGSELPGPELPS